MNIFLTGGNGFIGRPLAAKLIDYGYNVYNAEHNELPINPTDIIIHLAAVTTLSTAFNPKMYDTNIVYASKIMSYPCRIIYASSTSAAENTNPYAATKMYLEYLGNKHPNATGLRFFNVYGPGNNKGIVKRAIECAETGELLKLCGGSQIRDFIYIDDVVRAIINSLDSTEKIIDVGTGTGLSIHDALRIIGHTVGRHIDYESLPPEKTDMRYSVARPGIPDCLSFGEGIKKMLMI